MCWASVLGRWARRGPCSCADERQMHHTNCEWGQQMPDSLCWRGGKWTKTSKIEVLDSLLSWLVQLRLKGGIINHFVVNTIGEEGPVWPSFQEVKSQMVMWVPGPPRDQQVLLTAEPCFQPWLVFWNRYSLHSPGWPGTPTLLPQPGIIGVCWFLPKRTSQQQQ